MKQRGDLTPKKVGLGGLVIGMGVRIPTNLLNIYWRTSN